MRNQEQETAMYDQPDPGEEDKMTNELHEFIQYTTDCIAAEIVTGRVHAHDKHGKNSIEAINGRNTEKWLPILGEEFGEVCQSLTYDKDSDNLRTELIDVVTVGIAWIAALDAAKVAGQKNV